MQHTTKKMALKIFILSCFILLSFSIAVSVPAKRYCAYTLFIGTGTQKNAQTDSKINVTLSSSNSNVSIFNIARMGDLGSKYDYFERGNIDAFSTILPCLNSTLCSVTLFSDGSGGQGHNWYCTNVTVRISGPTEDYKTTFTVNQWLSNTDAPYSLNATGGNCSTAATFGGGYKKKYGLIESMINAAF